MSGNYIDDRSVYAYRNILNGKMYVGQTQNIEKRCRESCYVNEKEFYKAIKEDGASSFTFVILKEHLTCEEADYWEQYFIKFFDTTNKKYGYNILPGGRICALYGINNGFFGKKHSEEAIERMKAAKRGGNNPKAKPVLCENTKSIFPSCKEASDWCGISKQNINRVCRGERKHAGRHPDTGELLSWRYC